VDLKVTMSPPSAESVAALLRGARLSTDRVSLRLAQAWEVDYWRKLCPDLPVLSPMPLPLDARSWADADAAAAQTLQADGVFHARQVVAPHVVQRMNRALNVIAAAGWPAAFAFVYDDFWLCSGLPVVKEIVSRALGNGCQMIPHVWTHVVQPIAGAAGFPPHIDGDRPNRMSVWVALTEATLENGCMYVVPRSLQPGFSTRFRGRDDFKWSEVAEVLHAARPLPAAAGDALGWMFDVVHWGGRAQPPTTMRRSISLEFIAPSEIPAADELPLVNPGSLPSLSERLRAVASGLIAYRKFQPLLGRFEDVARSILEKTAV
jgi:hypothetical protein